MAWNRDPLSDIMTRTRGDMATRTEKGGSWLRRNILQHLADAMAYVAHALYAFMETQAKNLFTATADEAHLRREAAIFDITPAAAQPSTGTVVLSGAGTVEADELLQRADGVQFRILVETTFAGPTVNVAVEAVVGGAISNTSAGTPLSFVNPVPGVSSSAVVAVGGLLGGADAQGKESIRSAILERKRNPPKGGNRGDYIRWTKELFPAAGVWVYPRLAGPRTVGVFFVLFDRDNIIPTFDDIVALDAYLEPLIPVTADAIIYAPGADPLDMTLWITPDSAEVRAAVTAAVRSLVIGSAEPGGTVLLSKLREAVSAAPGEFDSGIISPVADVTAAAGRINIPGNLTFVVAP